MRHLAAAFASAALVFLLLAPAVAFSQDAGAVFPAAPVAAAQFSLGALGSAWTWLQLHWTSIAFALGVWAFLATVLNRVWPRPDAPPWKVWLHKILIDWPAVLPTVDMRGIFGLPVNVPFITLSKPVVAASPPPSGTPGASLLPLILVPLLLGASACSGITTAARITLAADEVLIAGEKGFGEYDAVHQRALSDADLAAYRHEQRPKVLASFEGLTGAARAARQGIEMAHAGKVELTPILAGVCSALGGLAAAGKEVGWAPPAAADVALALCAGGR